MTRIVYLAMALFCFFAPGRPATAAFPATQDLTRTALSWEPSASRARLLGPMEPAARLERMVLVLKASPSAQERLDRFLGEVQDPTSASYHRWLTPEQFGERFGPSSEAVQPLLHWLRRQGFAIDEVAQGRMSITFSGNVAGVQRAFCTSLNRFDAAGKERYAISVPPSIPAFLADRVEGLLSLHNQPRMALHSPINRLGGRQGFSLFGLHFLTPGDLAAIYNTAPLLVKGINGDGVAIAIVGRTHVPLSDVKWFRWLYGLEERQPALIVNGPDPGDQGPDENGEADLDVEWSGAVAPKADIKLVVSKSTATTDGVDLSAQYIVDKNLAPIMSVSFGACEKDLGKAGVAFYRNLWAQAAAQGITVVVASGDSGPSGCDAGSAGQGSGAAVSGLASTPSNVAVGGTQFREGTGGFWSTFNGKGGTSAKGYIPEAAWNESGMPILGGLWASSGGPSAAHAKPAWQQAPGVSRDGHRDLPDLSLAAAMANGYLLQTGGWPSVVGGTSCSAPAFAGIMALVVQHTGERQGNPCPRLYQLATAQYAGSGAAVFHDILVGTTHVPGTTGHACAPGYDQATGLGSVDAEALVEAWGTRKP